VIPITLNPDCNLIIRTILPVTYRDNITDGQEFGLGIRPRASSSRRRSRRRAG
jgi:hypothetical protein